MQLLKFFFKNYFFFTKHSLDCWAGWTPMLLVKATGSEVGVACLFPLLPSLVSSCCHCIIIPGISTVSSALNCSLDPLLCSSVFFFLTFHVVLPTHLALVLKRPDFNHCYKCLWISFLMVLEPASHMSSFVVFPCLTLAANITNDTGSSFGHTTFNMMDLASCLPQHGHKMAAAAPDITQQSSMSRRVSVPL